jgi:hypothetical protein
MNLYRAVADLLVSMKTFMKRMKTYRVSRPLSAIVLGSVSIILAILLSDFGYSLSNFPVNENIYSTKPIPTNLTINSILLVQVATNRVFLHG